MSSEESEFGIIGMAVMGQNLALNIEQSGYRVSVYNRTDSKTKDFKQKRASDRDIVATYELEEFISSLERPRKVLILVKAGKPVDMVIDQLLPLMEEGDIIIDGGNSHFQDTNRRVKKVEGEGLHYLGTGISGGEYGALHGPSIMPGGHREAYDEVSEILRSAAAQTPEGPTCKYLGPRSAGHYVKMVHNGIEYAVMQSIAEVYWAMKNLLDLSHEDMADRFEAWNQRLDAYLMEITVEILREEDEKTGRPLLEVILDTAKQKGTGKWTSQSALDLGVPVPTITAAVDARLLSARKDQRGRLDELYGELGNYETYEGFEDDLGKALYLSIVTAYAQGLDLLEEASEEYNYGLDIQDVAQIWKDGCIIRSDLLDPISESYSSEGLDTLLASEEFQDDYREAIPSLRKVVSALSKTDLICLALSASLNYFNSLTAERLPANMIQAQRDYFGAHTYQRVDEEGTFHTEWQDIKNV
ncbi:NADP-dependent phosphogluconate dehydrogenase [Candidatus Bipolaricaulota bacterium]|nr:NADP-dependent phosphogluconate dehydrogenase [Candidatus Bipolaricaulota bacterium]